MFNNKIFILILWEQITNFIFLLGTTVKLQLLKNVFLSVFLICTSIALSQTNTIDEENHTKALFHIRKNTDSIHFYINKMKQSKSQCRVFFAMLFEANTYYSKNEYKSCTKILDEILSEIDNNPKPKTFIYSEMMVGKTYEHCIDVIKLNVYRRFFFLRKNEDKLTEAYDYLLLMQNIIDNFPKNDIYYLKNKISTTYSMASLKRLLGNAQESLDILLKINDEIDSIPVLKSNIWYDNFQKEKANINVLTGHNYIKLEKYDLAELYYDKAYKATQRIDSIGNKPMVSNHYRKSELNYYKKDYKKALSFANKMPSNINDKNFNSSLFNIKAKVYSKLKNHDSAIYYSNKLVNTDIGLKYDSGEIYTVLAESYYVLNKIDSAYKYSQLSLKTYNNLNLQKNLTINVLNENQLSQAIALNKSIEKKRQSLKNKLIITILIAISFIALLTFYTYRKRKILNKKIETFKKQLEKSQVSNTTKKEPINTINDVTTNRILTDLVNLENSTIFLDKDFSLSVLAKLLSTNTSYLSKIINEYKQKTFKQYLIDLRINVLIKSLEENPILRKHSIEALAESIGYSNASSFTRIFKNHTGISPSQYLKEKYLDKK